MTIGPFTNEQEACEAFATLSNREERPAKFVAALHPLVLHITKWNRAEGKDEVALLLSERSHWESETSPPIKHVSVLAAREAANGRVIPFCCSIYIHEPTRVQTETYLTLENGGVKKILVYSVWLDPHFPFPDRVASTVARLRSKGVPMAPPSTVS